MEEKKKIEYLGIISLLLIIIPFGYILYALAPIKNDEMLNAIRYLPVCIGTALYVFGYLKFNIDSDHKRVVRILLLCCMFIVPVYNIAKIKSELSDAFFAGVEYEIMYVCLLLVCKICGVILLIKDIKNSR